MKNMSSTIDADDTMMKNTSGQYIWEMRSDLWKEQSKADMRGELGIKLVYHPLQSATSKPSGTICSMENAGMLVARWLRMKQNKQ